MLVGEAGQPYDILDTECPSRVVFNRIGDRWSMLVFSALDGQVLRFTQLKHRVGGVTSKVLTETLRALEFDGLVAREVFAEVPPRVEYRLTPLGNSLQEPVRAIRAWAEHHVADVYDARERHEALTHTR